MLAHQARRALLPRELVPQGIRGVSLREPAHPRGRGFCARLVRYPVPGLGHLVPELLHWLPGPGISGHRHQLAGFPGRLTGLWHRISRLGQRRRLLPRLRPRRLVRELQRPLGGAEEAGSQAAAAGTPPGQGEPLRGALRGAAPHPRMLPRGVRVKGSAPGLAAQGDAPSRFALLFSLPSSAILQQLVKGGSNSQLRELRVLVVAYLWWLYLPSAGISPLTLHVSA